MHRTVNVLLCSMGPAGSFIAPQMLEMVSIRVDGYMLLWLLFF